MKKDRKKTLLGLFIFGALLLGLVFVVFFGGADFFRQRKSFILFFDTSVKGLHEGAAVLLRGVKVGQVTDIQLRTDPEIKEMLIPVIIELDPTRIQWAGTSSTPELGFEDLIDRGLKGQLILQSFLTGSSTVQLDFFPEEKSDLQGGATQYPEIPTVPSKFQELTATVEKLPLEELANKLVSTLEGIEKTVNSPAIPRTLGSLNRTMLDLQQTVQDLQHTIPSIVSALEQTLTDMQTLIQNTNTQISQAGSGFNATRQQTEHLLQQLSRETADISAEIRDTATIVQRVFKEVQATFSQKKGGFLGQLSSDLTRSFSAVRSTLEQTEKTLAALQAATGEDSALRFELTRTLKELSAAARSIRNLSDYLERHPEALFKGKQNY